MKTIINLPLGSFALYCLPDGGSSSAEAVMPFPFQGCVKVDQASELDPDDNLGGATIVTLFETEPEMDAFCEGLELANPGDDCTWERYEMDTEVEGCLYAVVFHDSDAASELSLRKYTTVSDDTAV